MSYLTHDFHNYAPMQPINLYLRSYERISLRVFIFVINQLDAQNLFYNKFISCPYMFRAPCAHRQGVKNCIIQHLVSSHL